jgi:hypothetical protein
MSKVADSTYIINGETYTQLVAFTRPADPKARRELVLTYFNSEETDVLALRITKLVGAIIVVLACLSAIIGGAVSGQSGALIGLGFGALVGVTFTIAYGAFQIHADYQRWISFRENQKVINQFKELHLTQLEKNDDFLDPMDLVLFAEPMMAPCGHTGDKESLKLWLSGNTTCPICRTNIDEDQLSFDFIMKGKMKMAEAELAKKEMDNPVCSPNVKSAFKTLHLDLKQQGERLLEKGIKSLMKLRKDNTISKETFDRKMNEVSALYPDAKNMSPSPNTTNTESSSKSSSSGSSKKS